mgnify:CR=1 FL=1
MTDLIARLEAATEGSRELDAEIGAKFGALRYTRNAPNISNQPIWPPYTTSIDAALTLVPEGWTGHLMWQSVAPGAKALNMADCWFLRHGHPIDAAKEDIRNVIGATPAIALYIAALKARSTT